MLSPEDVVNFGARFATAGAAARDTCERDPSSPGEINLANELLREYIRRDAQRGSN